MERFPVLKTQRLLLREFHEDDAQALFEILSDVQVNRFLPMFPLASLPQAKAYLKSITWATRTAGTTPSVCGRRARRSATCM